MEPFSLLIQILRCVLVERDTPWCFYPDGGGGDGDCSNYNWVADGPGFTQEFYDKMYANYRANLDVEDSGAVVAAPDDSTPGGSYYYHWMRDAGLSIKAWMDINDNDYNTCREVLEGYMSKVFSSTKLTTDGCQLSRLGGQGSAQERSQWNRCEDRTKV